MTSLSNHRVNRLSLSDISIAAEQIHTFQVLSRYRSPELTLNFSQPACFSAQLFNQEEFR